MFIKYKVEGLFLFFWKEKKGRETNYFIFKRPPREGNEKKGYSHEHCLFQ